MAAALSIKNLCKTYSNGVSALKGISLDVMEGDFFALLGPNGAGKSTTIGIITSLINKTSGQVSVFGKDIDQELETAKGFIGLVPQEFNFNIFEPIIEILVNQAGYYGISRKLAFERAEKYLHELGLWEKRFDQARELSGGMKRRLMIARSLVHEPKLLILDEPTAGVDIEIRHSMWRFLRDLNNNGTTIILTTHYLEEAENLCRNIAIIDHGVLAENTSMKELLNQLSTETFILDLEKPVGETLDLDGCKIKFIDDLTIEADVLKDDSINKLFECLTQRGIGVMSMRNKTNRLEQLFMSLTGSASSLKQGSENDI
jgi:ABC-2 type transport system ATP-binding protein